MGAFTLHPLLASLKVRVTSLHQHGDRLYLGTATGTLLEYSYALLDEDVMPKVKLIKRHNLYKKPIEQIGVLGESNLLAVLSDSTVTLYPIAELATAKGRPLTAARNAHSFAITTYDPSSAKGKKATTDSSAPAVLRELVLVGCRKKVVVYGGGKELFKDPWELVLPHSPRLILIPTSSRPTFPETVHLLYSPSSSVLLHIHPSGNSRLSITELPADPPPPPIHSRTSGGIAVGQESSGGLGGIGVGSLSGLGGYVGLGGKAAIPVGTSTVGGEVLLAREGLFYSSEGTSTRSHSLQWSNPPDALLYSNPYIYSAIPYLATSGSTNHPSSAIEISLAPTLSPRETLTLPTPSAGGYAISSLASASSSASTPAETMRPATKALFVSSPTDKPALASEGSSIWALQVQDVGSQVDNLIREGRVGDAIGLVESVGEHGLDPARRLRQLRILQAVVQFAKGQYQSAIDTFLTFNVNPALVISLYPAATISGPLHVERDKWMELFGAVEGARLEPEEEAPAAGAPARGLLKSITQLGGITKRTSMDSLRPGTPAGKDDAVAPEEKSAPVMTGEEALEALIHFLSDRRQKITGAMSALPPSTPLPAESSLPPLSTLPATELHTLPNVPFTELSPSQLLRVAQVTYTALLKAYLVARPVLVGSLCRIENWCDVAEVEELLKAQKKFGDLIDLYHGKKMHSKALKMLQELAKDEEDRPDKYPPTVRYLQKLGPGELDLIFEFSKWIFDEDSAMALQIFTADEPEVESLPHDKVVAFLDKANTAACVEYLEHVFGLGEEGAEFHDKLAELYMEGARNGKDAGLKDKSYGKLLGHLHNSNFYRAHRLIGKLKANEFPEARAILLGRMGKNEEALRIYIYTLQDFSAAEAFCAKVYQTNPDPSGIFLLLLRLYLNPSPPDPVHLIPALELIGKHGIRLDATAVLDLLPPLVTMEEVRAFFTRTLRDGHAKRNDWRIVRSIASGRKEEVDRTLMGLQVKRVRVTDQRICPQCQKRLGQSAIAVHAPRGEVTHLHCKDPFSAKLAKARG